MCSEGAPRIDSGGLDQSVSNVLFRIYAIQLGLWTFNSYMKERPTRKLESLFDNDIGRRVAAIASNVLDVLGIGGETFEHFDDFLSIEVQSSLIGHC